MTLKESVKNNIGVLEISAQILGDSDATNLQIRVKDLISKGIKRIVFDLAAVKLANSIGIGNIMACLTSLRKAGGELKLSAVSEKIIAILSLTELDQFFDIYNNKEEAIASFQHLI
jgi:anti-sigma B factor antagonist